MRLTRRDFLKGMGLVAGGIGATAAGWNRLIPFLHQPEDIIPGVPISYATSCRECPAGCAMLILNRDARAIKCEGNPLSPLNRGALCARGQAALHGLYDPDRITGPMRRNRQGKMEAANWSDALAEIGKALAAHPRIAFISDLQTGSMDTLIHSWLAAFGSDRLLIYEPINYESVKAVNGGVVPYYPIAKSDFIISLAADFLETWISPVEYAKDFAEMRSIQSGKRGGFAYIGPRVSMTAANADQRALVAPGLLESAASAIVSATGNQSGLDDKDISRIRSAISTAKSPIVLPGPGSDSARAASLLNSMFGSSLADRSRPHALSNTSSRADIANLTSDMENGNIDVLVIYGANPVYALPDSERFIRAFQKVPMTLSLSSFMDETTVHAHWVLPSNTPLESWGDYQPYPDIVNLMQPVMGQLYNTRQTGDILIQLAQHAGIDSRSTFKADSFYEYLRQQWGFPLKPGESPENPSPDWEGLLQKGGRWSQATTGAVAGTGAGRSSRTAPPTTIQASGSEVITTPPSDKTLQLWAYPHIYYYDGRGANRRWLQEIPEPVTKCVWGTWAELHPDTAKKIGAGTDDLLEISSDGKKIVVPAYVWPGVAPDTVAIPIGEGHREYGRFASGTGENIFPLIDADNPAVEVRVSGDSRWAARIGGSVDQHGRNIIRTADISTPIKREKIALPLPSGYKFDDFYPGHKHSGHRWAMTADLDKCIGCHACVTACYAENNQAIVGPEEIHRRREMSWLRIDRYMDWDDSAAPILFQPMLCQHCDSAPCESVCPVYASSHNQEGVNMQVYNRCIGTRYCANNCPYKVRRFNWYDFKWPPPLQYQLNPDVTVRCRGVMEKCTFCIQRIRYAEITAIQENRQLTDGEITPACAQTCPTGVFTFGDLMDENSRVSKLVRSDPRAYQVLAELNTKPAVIYLKKIVTRV